MSSNSKLAPPPGFRHLRDSYADRRHQFLEAHQVQPPFELWTLWTSGGWTRRINFLHHFYNPMTIPFRNLRSLPHEKIPRAFAQMAWARKKFTATINSIEPMKLPCLLLLTALLTSTHSAFARIGETRQEIDRRYGEGKRSDIQRLEGAETIKYHLNNFQIEVVFHDNKSIWEIAQRQDRLIDSDDIKILLKANSADGRTWHFYRLNHRWERPGDPLYIAYLWPGHEDYFCIEDVKACEALQNSEGGDLKGF
ncbi:MAG: hypothetical protein WAO02_02850 [Verrucomicrobiia bacterium]